MNDRPDRARPGDEDFGPRGYLPPEAAHRARKIVLRAPLGLQWVVAAVVAGVVLVAAGVLVLRSGDEAPSPPWVAAAALGEVAPSTVVDEPPVLLVRAGAVRAFVGPEDLRYCPTSNLLEARQADHARVWSLTGRALDGGASLTQHPVRVHEGTVYVDPTRTVGSPPGSDEDVSPGCVGVG